MQGDESTSSTRVHQINLTSGGSVTVKSTSSEESYYAFPVQGYFSLGSSTKITEGSLRSTAEGINASGGKLFVADNTTNQVVVAYGTLYTGAGAVSVNGHSFASDKLYYKNGGADTTNDSTGYNAHYDPATGVLELKDYNSGPIIIGGSNAYDLTVKLTGTNTVTTSAPIGGVGNVCVGINITKYKLMAFIISAALAGVAGVLYAHNLATLTALPKNFGYNQSIMILVFVVLGGIGSTRGSMIAAVVLTLLPELLRGLNDYRMLIYAIVLIVMMLLNWSPKALELRERYSPKRLLAKRKEAKEAK